MAKKERIRILIMEIVEISKTIHQSFFVLTGRKKNIHIYFFLPILIGKKIYYEEKHEVKIIYLIPRQHTHPKVNKL